MDNSFPPSFGIEISKHDLDRLSETVLTSLVLHHKFLLIRSLSLTPDQLIGYGRKFGNLYLSSSDLKGNGETPHMKSKQHREISVLSRNGMHQNSMIQWHIDLVHKPSNVLPGRILYAHQSEVESLTSWTDNERAFELIDSETREIVEKSMAFYSAPYPTSWTGASRQMVFDHPLTQRRSLILDKAFTRCVIGKTFQDTEAMKANVFSRSLADDNIYTHNRQRGDLIIYDNNSTMHQREMIITASKGNRTLWRLTFDFNGM